MSNGRCFIPVFCFLIILTGLAEAIWGLMQLYGFRPSQHNLFKLTGSFFNPGPYAGYLAVVFPLALRYFLAREGLRTKPVLTDGFKIRTAVDFIIPFIQKWLSGITCTAIILVLPVAMSRASWLAAIAGSIVVIAGQWSGTKTLIKIFSKPATKGLKIFVSILVFCVIMATFAGMYYLKKDSADGRLLMWKVSLSAIVQHPLGVGLGHFPNAYGEAQAACFASGNATETEEYVAGNPEYGFNEFLQIAIESGIAALLLFIGMLVCAFRGLIKSKEWGVTGSLVALLVFACFSYPFSVLPFLTVFVFLLAISGSTRMTQIERMTTDENKKSVLIRLIRVIRVPISCLIVPNRIYPYYLLMKLYVETGDREKALENAQIVLTKEPKVQSTAVREMREEARLVNR